MNVTKHVDYLRGWEGYMLNEESLKHFESFCTKHPSLIDPKVGITPNGYVDARWDDTILEFLPDGQISLATRESHGWVCKRVTVQEVDILLSDNP